MTTPKIETFYKDGARWYEHPLAWGDPPLNRPWTPHAMGVTSVLNILAKPALVPWASKMAAEFAVDNKASWENLSRTAAVGLIKDTHKRHSGDAAEAGTDVHSLIEMIAAGVAPDFITQEAAPYIGNFGRFLKESKGQAIFLEQTVWNHTVGYAGSFDGIWQFPPSKMMDQAGFPDGIEHAVVDVKTGRSGIYPETALQQIAYSRAECMVAPDGTETPMPKIDAAFAFWVRREGYALHPLDVSDETWEAFQSCVALTRWKNGVGASSVRRPVNVGPLRYSK